MYVTWTDIFVTFCYKNVCPCYIRSAWTLEMYYNAQLIWISGVILSFLIHIGSFSKERIIFHGRYLIWLSCIRTCINVCTPVTYVHMKFSSSVCRKKKKMNAAHFKKKILFMNHLKPWYFISKVKYCGYVWNSKCNVWGSRYCENA